MALLLILAACQGETPTQPRPGSGGGSGTPPPTTSVAIALSVSNASPVVSSTSTVSASVTQGGAKVPDGTAVEFSTDFGTFTDTGTATTIRTTTNGVAMAVLTSPAPGTANVTARVNSANSKISVAFRTSEPIPGPPVPTISSVTPTTASPAGGTTVIIRGANLTGPVKVLFGDKEAIVVSRTDSQITVLTPKIDLGPSEQFREIPLVVITQAGTAAETLVNAPANFRFEITILTPVIRDIAPSEGPNEGNTRITIFGEAFQAPVRVFFGTSGAAGGSLADQVEAEVQSANFDQIIVLTPPATGLGTLLANKPVFVRVLNSSSGKDAVMANGFRYGPDVRITAAGPTTLSPFGGDKVAIDGWGFDDPVAVSLAGVAASPIFVSGTKLIVISSAPLRRSCEEPFTGPVSVTNVEDGTGANGPIVTYAIPNPGFGTTTAQGLNPAGGMPGTVVIASLNGVSGNGSIKVGGKSVQVTVLSYNATLREGSFQFAIPSTLTFDTQTCGSGGVRSIPTAFTVTFTDSFTHCDATLTEALTVTPADQTCRNQPLTATVSPGALDFGSQAVGAGPTATQIVTIKNTGTDDLIVQSVTSSDASFIINGPANSTITGGATTTFTVAFDPASPGAKTGTITVTSNAPDLTVSAAGDATP